MPRGISIFYRKRSWEAYSHGNRWQFTVGERGGIRSAAGYAL